MEIKELKRLLVQLAKGEQIIDAEQASIVQQKLADSEELRTLLEDYRELHQDNKLDVLVHKPSFSTIQDNGLIEKLKSGEATARDKEIAALKLLTNVEFKAKYDDAFLTDTTQTRVIPMRRILGYTLRIAASLLLLIGAWWFIGQAVIYNQALTSYAEFEQAQANAPLELGGEGQMTGSVCSIVDQFDEAVANQSFIYLPDGGARVTETGSRFGVKYYVVQEQTCEVTVLIQTDADLPAVGALISIDARAFEISALGQSLRVLIEEQRHVIY